MKNKGVSQVWKLDGELMINFMQYLFFSQSILKICNTAQDFFDYLRNFIAFFTNGRTASQLAFLIRLFSILILNHHSTQNRSK